MKKELPKLVFILFVCILSQSMQAQIGIGTTSPHASSILDVESTTKGFLPPRMTSAQRDLINGGTPSEGLMIYNSDVNCLEVYNLSNWVTLCDGSQSGPTSIGNSGVTGTITGNLPGYAETSVFQNIRLKSKDRKGHDNPNHAAFYIGGNRKKIYTNLGAVYSTKEKYREYKPSGGSYSLPFTTEVLAVKELIPNKTWKDIDYAETQKVISDLFLLSDSGEIFSMSFLTGYGISLSNIDPNDSNNTNPIVYDGTNQLKAYTHYANGTETQVKFDAIYLASFNSYLEFVVFAYSRSTNKFYSMGVEYSSPKHKKLSANKMLSSTAPTSLKDSYTLREAEHLSNALALYSTSLKEPIDDEVTFWVDKTANSSKAFMITEDGYVLVVSGSSIQRINFPTGVKAKSFIGDNIYSAILADDGKLYNSGQIAVEQPPVVYNYTSPNPIINGITYSVRENTNLPNKLYIPISADINNFNIKDAIGGYGRVTFITADGDLYYQNNFITGMSNNVLNTNRINLTSEYNLEPIQRIVGNGGIETMVQGSISQTFVINRTSNSATLNVPCGYARDTKFCIDDKGDYYPCASYVKRPVLLYNYLHFD